MRACVRAVPGLVSIIFFCPSRCAFQTTASGPSWVHVTSWTLPSDPAPSLPPTGVGRVVRARRREWLALPGRARDDDHSGGAAADIFDGGAGRAGLVFPQPGSGWGGGGGGAPPVLSWCLFFSCCCCCCCCCCEVLPSQGNRTGPVPDVTSVLPVPEMVDPG